MKNQTFSGIEVLGDISWGSHFSYFYQTTDDLLDTLVPYFTAGLRGNEFCLWIVSNSELLTVEEAKEGLQQAMPDLERYLTEGNIEIVTHDDWFLNGKAFDLHRVANRFKEKLDEALARGYSGMRVNGSPAWLQKENRMQFCEFEEELNRLFPNERMIISCTFPLTTITGDEIFEITQRHQFAIARRYGKWEVIETPELKQAKSEIKRLNEELEQKVGERTAQLAAANEELKHEIAERKKAEEELQQMNEELHRLSSHLQNIQENERTAIAREIHDELGQQLTALKMEVGWLNKKLPDDIILKEKVNEILSLISEILKTVKRIAVELRPNILDELGLVAALTWQGQELEKRTGIKFQFYTDLKDFNPERNLSTNIFRLFQEALTNVARHAYATQIETALEKKDDYISLTIKDNGQGFEVEEAKNKNSLGLIGMNERALMLQGELTIESKKLKGTIITLKVPSPETNKKKS